MSEGPFVHYCSFPGCGEWGAFGSGNYKAGWDKVVWRCAAHRLAPKAEITPDADGPQPVAPKQGRLL